MTEYSSKDSRTSSGMKLNLLPPQPKWTWPQMFSAGSVASKIIDSERQSVKDNKSSGRERQDQSNQQQSGMTLNLLPKSKPDLVEIFLTDSLPGKIISFIKKLFESSYTHQEEMPSSKESEHSTKSSGMKLNLLPKNRR